MNSTAHEPPCFVQTSAETLDQRAVSARYWRLRLRAPEIARRARPGQFAMLSVQPDALPDNAACDPLLPRPLALLDADAKAGTIELLYFVAGRGTALLQNHAVRPGTRLRILGPLGNGFTVVDGAEAHIAVGGGSGVAPLVYFFRKAAFGNAPRIVILAARTKEHLAERACVDVPGAELREATDDGSAGFRGNAVEALRALLDGPMKGKRAAVYAAGPEPMMDAAAKLAGQRGLPCRVSLEARMACGVGVCRSCVVDARTPHPATGLFRRTICQDGPVFDPCELKDG